MPDENSSGWLASAARRNRKSSEPIRNSEKPWPTAHRTPNIAASRGLGRPATNVETAAIWSGSKAWAMPNPSAPSNSKRKV